MAVWETDDELSSAVAASLPAPSNTPYRTPSRSSRRSRRSVTPPGVNSSPPPPLPSDKTEKLSKRSSKDVTMDETISVLDPRRFTPTLHANLVSEILTLRRDQEEKLRFIESLEEALHTTKEEHESLESTLLNTAKESRSLKRQLALLEGGTSSALGELARERDEAVDAITETKKRFDTAQKKIRSQEDDSQRVHDLWAKEKDDWAEERRKYERKLHVADSRLKAILEEVAHFHAAQANGHHNGVENEFEDGAKENDGASIRTMSMTNSIRYSTVPGKLNGNSLADELNFDDDDEYETEPDGRQSVMSNNRHRRNQSRDSVMSKTAPRSHRRNISSDSQMRPGSVARGRMLMTQNVLERLEGGIREDDETPPIPKPEYKDTAIQYSPPPSPKLVPLKPSTPEPIIRIEKPVDVDSPSRGEWEIEANQRRKRVHINKSAPIEPPSASKSMVSAASQTLDEPSSHRRTPESLSSTVSLPAVEARPAAPQMKSSATQTPDPPVQKPVQSTPLSIPSISIHPPTSRPTTPREHRLPQYVKDFGCQVSILRAAPSKSIAVQTDEIRIDRRLDKLPAHLHPSAISSRPASPNPAALTAVGDGKQHFTPIPGTVPPRNPRRLTSKRSFLDDSSPPASPNPTQVETRDAYPGNNDDGPLSSQNAPMRRPHRISSLFAGFEAASSDEVDEFGEGDGSDSEFRTALSAPRPKGSSSRHRQRESDGTTSTIDTTPSIPREHKSSMKQTGSTEVHSSSNLGKPRDTMSRKPSLSKPTSSRAGAMRKSAMIQNGIASHQGRSRSPSLPDPRDPPFPIPTRASSRKPPFSISAPSDGQRSPTRGEAWHRRGTRGPYRINSVRKSRSAAALPHTARHRRQGSRSPPPMSPSEEAPQSPSLPPLPSNDITTPRHRDFASSRFRSHRSQPSTTTANTDYTNMHSVGSSQQSQQQAPGVVDAIAQTMVGEWMFKYVRRRKSFGMPDAKADENSNDRHKRWVWLAPYERAILWSSKQPSSGSALMGKSGRKLTIQSVLDVKDDNSPPKGVSQLFNRSILILTPQRALKFTAASAERHYLWLTSLSFLAHSQQAIPEIISPTAAAAPAPPAKLAPTFTDPPPIKSKRPGIRDSIMLKKGKSPGIVRPDNTANISQLEEAFALKPESFAPVLGHQREVSRDVAEPPFIPRFQERSSERVHERANQVMLHGRKRSNTGGHVKPPLSFRGFSGPVPQGAYHAATNSTADNSVGTAGSSDIYTQGSSAGNTAWAMSTVGSQRTSEASSRPGNNFFEAIGTVRMEAFISPLAFPRVDENPDEHEELRYRARRRSKEIRRHRSRSRHRDSYNSRTTRGTDDWYGGSRTGGEEDYFRDDPFKGF
ncbi:nuclear migration protein [Xylariales sp. AK1849]|nr:nuclear migration protein [Xylariales sp. AK1849]